MSRRLDEIRDEMDEIERHLDGLPPESDERDAVIRRKNQLDIELRGLLR